MKYKFTIEGLDCPNCAAKLADKMAAIPDIDSAKINFLTEKLTVESTLDEAELLKTVTEAARAFSKSVKIEK